MHLTMSQWLVLAAPLFANRDTLMDNDRHTSCRVARSVVIFGRLYLLDLVETGMRDEKVFPDF